MNTSYYQINSKERHWNTQW